MPLWAESRADPRKIQANMLTEQWRQRLTRNLQPAGSEAAAANTWFTPSCHLNPHHMLENRHEAGYLKSSTVNETTELANTGINSIRTQTCTPPICLLYTTLMISIYPGAFKLNYKALFKALRVNMLLSQVIPSTCDGKQQNSRKQFLSFPHTQVKHTKLHFDKWRRSPESVSVCQSLAALRYFSHWKRKILQSVNYYLAMNVTMGSASSNWKR